MSIPPRRHIVVLSGAGISAESGLPTFRDHGGLWEGVRFEEVATPAAWAADPGRVLRFYNERRRALRAARPNAAHLALAALEKYHEVTIVTQNVDDLHERAGSSRVIHLHGQLTHARGTLDESLVYPLYDRDIELGDLCELGSQLRPHVVWFGEPVPELEKGAEAIARADALLVVGTSLAVYPAACLIHEAPARAERIMVNPEIPEGAFSAGFECVRATASAGVPLAARRWMPESDRF